MMPNVHEVFIKQVRCQEYEKSETSFKNGPFGENKGIEVLSPECPISRHTGGPGGQEDIDTPDNSSFQQKIKKVPFRDTPFLFFRPGKTKQACIKLLDGNGISVPFRHSRVFSRKEPLLKQGETTGGIDASLCKVSPGTLPVIRPSCGTGK